MAQLNIKTIVDKLSGQASGFLDLSYLDSIGSTNEVIKEAARTHAPEGRAVIALEQTGGYGRQGRFWSSPEGGVYFSILLRPLDSKRSLNDIPTLSLVLSLAVKRVLQNFGVCIPIKLKWPNDLLCDRGKLSGISLEALEGALCVGVGVNLFVPQHKSSLEGKYDLAYAVSIIEQDILPHSVCSRGITAKQAEFIEDVAAALLSEVVCLYSQWLIKGFAPFKDEYESCCALRGQAIRVLSQTSGILHEGVVQGIDEDGCLCLQDGDGKIIRAHSGEVHLV